MMHFEMKQAIEKEGRHKEMMAIFKRTLTRLKKIKLNGSIKLIDAISSINPDDFVFRITVFSSSNDNVTFNFYDFYELEKIKLGVDEVVLAIKSNDFKLITELENKNTMSPF